MKLRIVFLFLLFTSWIVRAQTVTSFDGIDDSQVHNPQLDIDPNGAIGTKQYLEWINLYYQAFDKVTFAPLWATPFPGNTPWLDNNLQNCLAFGGDGLVNFDRLASRWIIAAHTSPANSQYYFCIAISNTDDLSSPALAWYTYGFFLNPFLGTNSQGQPYFPDWPKIGTWQDAYYVSFDLQDVAQKHLTIGVLACALDRANMINGGTPNPMQCFSNPSPIPTNGTLYLAHSMVPADIEGTNPPPSGRDEFFVSIQNPPNDGKTVTSNLINLWDFHVDWVNPSNSTFTNSQLKVPTYTPGCYQAGHALNTICVPELAINPTTKAHYHVDSVGDRLMPRMAYRNFGTYESFLVSHAVRVGLNASTQTGIRWYELRGSGTPTIYQNGTVSPDKSLYRFMPSIAQDKNGNAAVGYSVSNAASHPGIKAAWWTLNPKGAPKELAIQTGAGDEEDSKQWGDYTSMTVDPVDDCTFWYVNEYLPANEIGPPPDRNTRIANFKISTCGQPSKISFVQVAAATPGNPQTTVSVTYPSSQVQGDMNIVAVGWNDNAASIQSVTDSLGNNYTLAIGPTTGTNLNQSIYFAPNIHSGTNTVTVTFNQAASYPDVRILEYSGLDPVSPLDVTAGASGNSSTSSSGSANTNFASELIFGANTVFTLTQGPGPGFTSRIITFDGDIAEDEFVGATGTYTATAPLKTSGPWVMQMCAFKAAGQ